MKLNNTAFGHVQNKALQNGVGAALDEVAEKVNDVDKRMLNYTGDWVTDNEYHVNDVVTWSANGHLYEVIKAHTSSASFDPDNPEYYKPMTATKYHVETYTTYTNSTAAKILDYLKTHDVVTIIVSIDNTDYSFSYYCGSNYFTLYGLTSVTSEGNQYTVSYIGYASGGAYTAKCQYTFTSENAKYVKVGGVQIQSIRIYTEN